MDTPGWKAHCVAMCEPVGLRQEILSQFTDNSDMPELPNEALLLNWTQNVVIMEAELTMKERRWYIQQAATKNLSKLELLRMIEDSAHLESVLDEKADVWYNEANDKISERTQHEEDPVYLPRQYLKKP